MDAQAKVDAQGRNGHPVRSIFSETCFGACAPKENGAQGHCITLKKVKLSFFKNSLHFPADGCTSQIGAQGWNGHPLGAFK